jgi:hypothetical protein
LPGRRPKRRIESRTREKTRTLPFWQNPPTDWKAKAVKNDDAKLRNGFLMAVLSDVVKARD